MDQKYAQFEAAPEKVEDGKHIYGDLGARFTLVEFSDMECPFCKQFHDTPGNDSNLLIVFYVQIMPDDFVMQLHRF
ncbi:hypothetical protein AM375_00115 (plasmid) [Escherichia coli]|nr:hypothetical protein AM375_00115 [Escherichia coli]